jgi:hypothetical protein
MRSSILPALIAMVLAAAGCGGASLDCDALCKKSVECNPSQKLVECTSSCGAVSRAGNGAFLSALQACYGKSCNEVGACTTAALASCDGDPTPFFDDYCDKVHSCSSSISVETCKAQFSTGETAQVARFLKCINDGTLSQVSSCVQDASCDNLETASEKCLADQLGGAFQSTQ